MGIYRHETVLLRRIAPASTDAVGGTFVVRPVEGDAVTDHDQVFVLLVFVDQQGAGTVKFEFATSFGDGLWAVIKRRTLTADNAHMMIAKPLDGFAPYVKVRVTATAPNGSEVKPTFRVIARLVSDGPYRAAIANPPATIEAASTDGSLEDLGD